MDYLQYYLSMYLNEGIFLLKDVSFALLIFIFFLITKKFFTNVIFKFILKAFSHAHLEFAEKVLCSFKKPLQYFFVILGLYLALLCLPLSLEYQILISKLFRTALVILLTVGLYDLSEVNSVLFKKIKERNNIQLDKILFSFISKFIKVILILIAITVIAQEWDYDINGLIAGLGLGGLAIALAAQDSLSNIFGGIVIILDKPFSIGDLIKTPSVEGVVEELGFRSTKIRTSAQALVTVPNSTLAKESIINWSKMGKRQMTFELRLNLDTPRERIEKCVARIRTMLEVHPAIHQETILVTFDKISDDCLNLFLYFFTKTTVWAEFLLIKEEINLKILQILEEEQVNLALPGRKIYYDTPQNTKSASKE